MKGDFGEGEPSPAWGRLLRHAEGSPEMGPSQGIFVELGMRGRCE